MLLPSGENRTRGWLYTIEVANGSGLYRCIGAPGGELIQTPYVGSSPRRRTATDFASGDMWSGPPAVIAITGSGSPPMAATDQMPAGSRSQRKKMRALSGAHAIG